MTRVAIVGTGNIGTDLLEKVRRSGELELVLFAGIDPDSPGLARARTLGFETSIAGAEAVPERGVELVFEATSAAIHRANAARYTAHGITAVDLTPAKLGVTVVPAVNVRAVAGASNVSLSSCGAQATVPIVAAVAAVTEVSYAEIVATIASRSAGPGTRQNIDEFTRTTASALESVGGATVGKAIIILNPATPPIHMRSTVFALVAADADRDGIRDRVLAMEATVQRYVPGYRVVAGPEFDLTPDGMLRVAVMLEVTGAGDFLPPYAGNLDIITSAAVAVAERLSA
jgi:acetaldehyde dehydrogenase